MSGRILRRAVIPGLSASDLIVSVKDGLIARAKAIFAPLPPSHNNAIRDFYAMARGNEPDHDILDMSQGIYGEFLKHLSKDVPVFSTSDARILDLGCGNLSLLHFLINHGAPPQKYIGLDLIAPQPRASAILSNDWQFRQEGLEEFSPIDDLQPNLIIACNSLCYVMDADDVLSRLSNELKPGGKIVIIDPINSIFWENYFSGVFLTLRGRGFYAKLLERRGCRHIGDYLLYALEINGIPFWPIASLSIIEK